MRLALAAVLMLASAAALGGCAGAPPQHVDWRAEGRSLRDYPEEYRTLWVREVSVGAVAPESTAVPAAALARLEIDPRVVREKVVEALAGIGQFHAVASLEGPDGGAPPVSGLIVDLALDEAWLVHEGGNDDADRAFWLWLFTGLPGLAVRDQLYAFGAEPRARILDARTGETLVPWEPLVRPTGTPWALNFHERTTGFFSYVKTNVMPPTRIATDDRAILAEVLPPSLRPSLESLGRVFDQIAFLPVRSLSVESLAARRARVTELWIPSGEEVVGDDGLVTLDFKVELTPPAHVRCLRAGSKLLWTNANAGTHASYDFVVDGVEVPREGSLRVDLYIDGLPDPEPILELRAPGPGEIKPSWRRP